jgi:AbrB family looped-hinge helix DNA binding protein
MRASIDSEGRIIIPPAIRDAVGLQPGADIDVRVRGGVIEVAPVEIPVRLEQRKYLFVAVLEVPVEPMTTGEVDAVRASLLTDVLDGT